MPFVSFEGIDGSGKSTQLKRLADWLETRGYRVLRTKEPDGGRLGSEIRGLLTRERPFVLDAVEELLLVSAARYDHVRTIVRPALAKGYWVLSDRYLDSTYALQVHAGDAPKELLGAVNRAVVGETRPDLTLILDLSPGEALVRRRNRASDTASDPAEETRRFELVHAGFRLLAETEPERCRLVDGHRDEATVAESIRDELRKAGMI